MPETHLGHSGRDLTARRTAMRTTGAYLSADGLSARAGALRAVAATGQSIAMCSWLIAAQTKPATDMFVDSPNHRTRRPWEPS
jgi:hypothetical protein